MSTVPKHLRCQRPRLGWHCNLLWTHQGPCPAWPDWWNRAQHCVTRKWF